jgi:predicted cupin superfamily sugar epimerase
LPSRAEELTASLALAPHPEGGWFREWFRSPERVTPGDGRGERSAMTAIWFLLPRGGRSRWHVLRSDEQWTFLEGEPLELATLRPGVGTVRVQRLGPSGAGAAPSLLVPAGTWQAARAAQGHALVACTVSPGFEFEDFRLLSDDPAAVARLRGLGAAAAALL